MIKGTCNVKYRYSVYGLNIISDILISELLPGDGNADIAIILGKVPLEIKSPILKGEDYQMSKNEFLFYIEDIAYYYVVNGNQIIVEPCENSEYNCINTYLVSLVLGMALLQRGILSMHGSSVVIGGKCVVFTGDCGAGKSAICESLKRYGCDFLADDISVINLNEEGEPMVQPAFPQVRLCKDTMTAFEYDISEFLGICKIDDKFLLNSTESFKNDPMPLTAIIELCPEEDCNVNIKEIIGTEKLNRIIRNIYCSVLLTRVGIDAELFNKSLKVARKIAYYKIYRPIGKFTVEEQIELVRESLSVKL